MGLGDEDDKCVQYKAMAKFDVRVPWDQDALADNITKDPDITQVKKTPAVQAWRAARERAAAAC